MPKERVSGGPGPSPYQVCAPNPCQHGFLKSAKEKFWKWRRSRQTISVYFLGLDSTMSVGVGEYCVFNGWKFNVCCEFVGLKHWNFFIRQCLHTSPEEPLRVVYMKFKNILSCFKTMYSYKSWSYFNFEYVPSLLNIEILWGFCASVFYFPVRPCRKLCSCYWWRALAEIQAPMDFLCCVRFSCLVLGDGGWI